MIAIRTVCCFLVALFVVSGCGHVRSATLTCEGILGNSGEQGASLVRFSSPPASGVGVVCDRFGSLWDRAGDGTLNRYAVDGRLLGQYSIPRGDDAWTSNNQISLVGDTLVVCTHAQLYQLAVTAPPGTAATPMKVKADRISWNSLNGSIAISQGTALSLLKVAAGTVTPVATLATPPMWLEMGPDGAIYPVMNWELHKYVNGQEVKDGWPKAMPGERPQLLDGYWYGHTWHGTLKRFTVDLQSDPGVVLGGASGSFLGHLDQYSEITNGRGLAHLRDNLFAISGLGGVMHLLDWQPDKRQMIVVRRIGSITDCTGLGLDRNGNVWWDCGGWKWTDGPDSPMRHGVNNPEAIGQSVMLDSDCQVAAGWLWGQPTFYHGLLTGEVSDQRIDHGCSLSRGQVAATAYKDAQGKLVLLTLSASGKGQSFFIAPNGQYLSDAGPVALKTVTPVEAWTTLSMKGSDTLIGAGDGYIVEFARAGTDWTETKRWNQTDDGDTFGKTLYCSADSGRLWIADSDRDRVLVFDLATGKTLATFGKRDLPGNDLASMTHPEEITARGDRAIVFDQGNQRLIKLKIAP